MSISKLAIQNFKSINHAKMQFGDFSVLIGANAAGKSNIVQAVKFLKDCATEGFENAFSSQGGSAYFHNSQRNQDASIVQIRFDLPGTVFELDTDDQTRVGCLMAISYELTADQSSLLQISLAECITAGTYLHPDPVPYNLDNAEQQPACTSEYFSDLIQSNAPLTDILVTFNRKKLITYSSPDNKLLRSYRPRAKVRSGASPLLLQDDDLFGGYLQEAIADIGIYNFSIQEMKKDHPIAGRKELEPDGSNLALVLKNLMEDQEQRHQFILLLQYALPFINNVQVESIRGQSLVALLTEKYDENFFLPSVFFSEGTISIIALIIALFFEKKSVVIIEEPERYVHPSLLAKLIALMKDASRNKQVIITTHSPELVKHAGIENLLLVQRDKEGFTAVSRPNDNEMVKTFLHNEIGLDDLYIDNLLGV